MNRTVLNTCKAKVVSVLLLLSFSLNAVAQQPEPEFTPSSAQKGVATSTDVIAIALPAAALAGTLILKD